MSRVSSNEKIVKLQGITVDKLSFEPHLNELSDHQISGRALLYVCLV